MTTRWLDRVANLVGLRLLLWLVIAAVFAPGALVDPFQMLGSHDDHYFFMYDDVTRRTIVDYAQLPDWNPWYCGGVPAMGNPQGTPLSPDLVVRLVLGVAAGRRVTMLLFLVAGMEGLYRLARSWDCSPVGSVAGAGAWATSGWFAQSMHNGWLNHFAFLLLPWLLIAQRRGMRERWWRVGGGFLLAWQLGMGGTYSVPHAAIVLLLVCVVDTAAVVWTPRAERQVRWFAPALSLGGIGASSLVFGAAKWATVLEVIATHPRVWHPTESTAAPSFLDAMLRWQDRPPFVGSALLVAALLGVVFADRRAGLAVGLAAVLLALALGDQGPWSPFVWLRKLPAYSQLRGPERFATDATVFLSLAAARALTVIEDVAARATDRLLRVPLVGGVLGAALAALLGDAGIVTIVLQDRIRPVEYWFEPPRALAGGPSAFRQSRGNRWDAHVYPFVGLGSLQCFEEIPFPQSAKLRGDLEREEYPADASVASVDRKSWSPNEIVLAVQARTPTTVLVNQNWDRGWKSSVGAVRSDDGLLAVDVPAGDYEMRLVHRDAIVVAGVAVTLLAHLAALAMLVRAAARRFKERRSTCKPPPPPPAAASSADTRTST